MNVIEVKNLTKQFIIAHEKKRTTYEYLFKRKKESSVLTALNNISFELKKNESLGIIGRNGSGKTTLLKIVGGVIKPSNGTITVNGTLIPFIELGASFEHELTGRENVYLYGSLLGLSRNEIKKKYKQILDFAEIGDFIDSKLSNYSNGMILRLAFAVGVHVNADIILIDDILAVGDESFRKKCLNKMKELKAKGKSFILVSHSLQDVENFCDRCILLDKCQIKEVGNPRNVIDAYLDMIEKDKKTIELGKRLEKRYKKMENDERKFSEYIRKRMDNITKKEIEIEKLDREYKERNKEISNRIYLYKQLFQKEKVKTKKIGGIKIEEVKFYDERNDSKNEFNNEETIKVEISYNALKKIKNPIVGISIFNEEGLLISWFNNLTENYKIAELYGKGKIYCNLRPNNLPAGKYLISVDMQNEQHKHYDYIDRGFVLKITERKKLKLGLINIESNWGYIRKF